VVIEIYDAYKTGANIFVSKYFRVVIYNWTIKSWQKSILGSILYSMDTSRVKLLRRYIALVQFSNQVTLAKSTMALTQVRRVCTCLYPYPIRSTDRGRIAGNCHIVACTLPDRSALSGDPTLRKEPYAPSKFPWLVSVRLAWHRKRPARSTGIHRYCRSTVPPCEHDRRL